MMRRQLSKSIELRVTKTGMVKISSNPNFFVAEEEQKAIVNGKEVKL